MPQLILTNKIRALAPARSAKMQVERFATDNYTIRAAKGFNNIEVTYTVSWTKLTAGEAKQLGDFFDDTAGTSLIQWTPPYENIEQNFTVQTYDISLLDDTGLTATYYYTARATFIKEYDLT